MPSFILETVQDYIDDARTLLLDRIFPFRYSDDSLIVALNLSLTRTDDLRPDLFPRGAPSYDAVNGEKVPVPRRWRQAVVYGLVGHALIRDQEDVQDLRATIMQQTQEYLLTGMITRPPTQGGTTPPGNAQR